MSSGWTDPWTWVDEREIGNGLVMRSKLAHDWLERIMGPARDVKIAEWVVKWKAGECVGCTTRSAYGNSWEWVHVDSCPTHGGKAEKLIAAFLLAEGKWDAWKIVRSKSSGYDEELMRGTREECEAFLESFSREGYHIARMVPMREPVTE